MTTKVKYIIVGAGPGGLQMGYYFEKNNLDYVILERNDHAGSFFTTHPVHRKLISINKKYNYFPEEDFNWRHDWNSLLCEDAEMRFTNYTDEFFPHADVMCNYLQDYATKFKLKIKYNSEVAKISKNKEGDFLLKLKNGEAYQSQVLLMGLGTVSPKMPTDIEGIEHTTSYENQTLDLNFYRNKRVAILGGGNSAFETADYLTPVAAYVHVLVKRPLKMAWDTHFVGDLRAVNNNALDLYQLKSLHAVLNPRVRKISKLPDGTLQTHHEYDYPNSALPGTLKLTRQYDVIINCTGWKWSSDFLFDDEIKPQTKAEGKFMELNETWESVNVSNLFFIGGVMQSIDRKSASGFIHGFRYNIRTLSNILLERYEKKPYPAKIFKPFVWNDFLEFLYQRYSTTAALFQLYGFLSDVLIFSEDKTSATLHHELPIAYAKKTIPENRPALIFTLEFGFDKYKESSLNFLGPSDPNDSRCAAFLHPVIRHFYNGVQDEFHFGDSLLARWDLPHDKGGAVFSYHYDFQKWVKEKVGLEIKLPAEAPAGFGAYEVWGNGMTEHAASSATMPCAGGRPELRM